MYKGIIESESLIDKKILNEVRIVKSYKEQHLDEDPKIWTINKINVDDKKFDSFMKDLSKNMIKGWYSLLWNDKFVYVIFKNKIFKIKNINPWIKSEFSFVINYALSVNINKKYFDNLRKSIEEW
ncbi:MAG: hypothetical protein AABW50_01830 [Nanoarchaeota archaeon]